MFGECIHINTFTFITQVCIMICKPNLEVQSPQVILDIFAGICPIVDWLRIFWFKGIAFEQT